MFCSRCGMQLNEGSAFCPRCGAQVAPVAGQVQLPEDVSPKSRLATTLLAWFLGQFGAHRFYTGKIKTAVAMLLITILSYAVMIGAFIGMLALASDVRPPVLMFIGVAVSGLVHTVVWVWMVIDFVMAVTGNFKDNQGKLISKW